MNIKERIKEDSNGNLNDYLNDVINYGCASGVVSGLVYYNNTTSFYREYESEIWGALYNDSSNHGISLLDFIGGLRGVKDVCNELQFMNLLAWYYYERTCYNMLNDE